MKMVSSVEFTAFEWDTSKAELNELKHKITFEDAAMALRRPHLEYDSIRSGELRVVAICPHSNRIISVVYTRRETRCRIISARSARDYEQREYRLVFDSGN